jgi:LPS-assembly lipoprotein
MWSADDQTRGRSMRSKNRRSTIWVVMACAAMPALATGCGDGGFRPLYASPAVVGTNVNQKLAELDIAPIPGRVGQRLRNELIYQSTGGELPAAPVYRLNVVIRESITATLVRIDGDSLGSTYNLDASFTLIRLSDKAIMLEGKSYGRAPFQRFDSVFANVRARKDAEDRAARTIGDELKSRLAAFLSGAA